MPLPITSLYAALLIGVAIALMIWTINGRRDAKVGIGDGGDEELMRRMRSQANFMETAPLLLIALALMEANGMWGWFLHLFGIALVVSRAVHPIGMSNRYPQYPFRYGGTVTALSLFIISALVLLVQAFS